MRKTTILAQVIQKVDNAICTNIYPLDSDLSSGQRYPAFEQAGPGDQHPIPEIFLIALCYRYIPEKCCFGRSTSELAKKDEITILSARDTTRGWVPGRSIMSRDVAGYNVVIIQASWRARPFKVLCSGGHRFNFCRGRRFFSLSHAGGILINSPFTYHFRA